jgi:cell division protease FtsH
MRIDAAVQRLIAEAHQRARSVVSANRGTLDAIAAALLEAESLDGAALATLVAAHRPALQEPPPPPQDVAAPEPNGHKRRPPAADQLQPV